VAVFFGLSLGFCALDYEGRPCGDHLGIKTRVDNGAGVEVVSTPTKSQPSWLPMQPHVLIATMVNFMFGYHIGYDLLLATDNRLQRLLDGESHSPPLRASLGQNHRCHYLQKITKKNFKNHLTQSQLFLYMYMPNQR
jgi:hypothetical protein